MADAPDEPEDTKDRRTLSELQGATRLAVDGTRAVTDIVQAMHDAVGVVPTKLGPGLVYSTIRGVTRLVGAGVERALAALAPLLGAGDGAGTRQRELVVAAVNGVLGDYLAASRNPLAITAGLRRGGAPLTLTREALAAAIPEASGHVVLLVHGSAASDLGWRWKGHDHGAALEQDLGVTAVYARYNSGLHISDNGALLRGLIGELLAAWPVAVEGLHIVAHSMGGLVARSACIDAAWLGALRTMVFLGTPHHGASLERGGNWIDTTLGLTPWTRPLARLGKVRSAGVTDLRFGSVRASDWQARDRFALGRDPRSPLPLPAGVACYAVAATLLRASGAARDSDGMVSVESALGVDSHRPEMNLVFPAGHTLVTTGSHLDLLSSPVVYEQLRGWLAQTARRS